MLFSFVAVFIAASFLILLGLTTATSGKTDFSFLSLIGISLKSLCCYFDATAFRPPSYFLILPLLIPQFLRLWFNISMRAAALFPVLVILVFYFFTARHSSRNRSSILTLLQWTIRCTYKIRGFFSRQLENKKASVMNKLFTIFKKQQFTSINND